MIADTIKQLEEDIVKLEDELVEGFHEIVYNWESLDENQRTQVLKMLEEIVGSQRAS